METFLFNCFYISDLLWSTLLVTVVAFLALSLSNTKPHTLFLSLSNSTPYTIFLYSYPDALTHTRTHSLTRLHVWLKITPEKHLLEWESECRWVSERVDLQIKVREVPWIMQPPTPSQPSSSTSAILFLLFLLLFCLVVIFSFPFFCCLLTCVTLPSFFLTFGAIEIYLLIKSHLSTKVLLGTLGPFI